MFEIIKSIYFFMIPLVFMILAMLGYEKNTHNILKNKLMRLILFSIFISLINSMIYSIEITSLKIIFFNIFNTLLPLLIFLLWDFVRTYSKTRVTKLSVVICIIIMIISSLLYILFPFTIDSFEQHNFDWYATMFAFPCVIPFSVVILYYLMVVSRVSYLLYKHYKSTSSIRIKKATFIILKAIIFLTVAFICNIVLKYILFDTYIYSDFSMTILLLFICIILHCQRKYYFFDVEPNKFIIEMLDDFKQAFVTVDSNLNITWHNKEFLNLTDSKNSVLGSNIHNYIFTDKDVSVFKEKNKIEVNMKLNEFDKPVKMMYISLPVNSFDGQFAGAIYCFRNIQNFIDEQKHIEVSKKKLENKIISRTHKLREVNKNLKLELAKRIAVENEIFELVSLDSLTKMYNRRYILEKLKSGISNPRVNKIIILYLDIDDFKNINDSFGMKFGDALLQSFSSRLAGLFDENVDIARLGGDEFLIAIYNSDLDIAEVCMKIQNGVHNGFEINQKQVSISVSIGVSIYPDDAIDVYSLIKYADISMYQSKARGKCCFTRFDETLRQNVESQFILSDQLRHIIENEGFKILFQPRMSYTDAHNFSLSGLEVVFQLQDEDGKILDSNIFDGVSQNNASIKKIDRWILKRSLQLFPMILSKSKNLELPITIKISDKTFFDPLFVEMLKDIISANNVNPKNLEIEITEQTLMLAPDTSIKIISALKYEGITVSIDQFGLEYSSLNYLRFFNFDKIKINKNFTNAIGKNKKDEAIITLLISLSLNLGFQISAEGIHNQDQVDFLLAHKCNILQGEFFSQPLEVVELMEKIENETLC